MSVLEDTLKTKRVIESCIDHHQVKVAYRYLEHFKNKYKNCDPVYRDLYSIWVKTKEDLHLD